MNAAIPERRPVTEEISGLIERVTPQRRERLLCPARKQRGTGRRQLEVLPQHQRDGNGRRRGAGTKPPWGLGIGAAAAGPSVRLTRDRLESMVPLLRNAADKLSLVWNVRTYQTYDSSASGLAA